MTRRANTWFRPMHGLVVLLGLCAAAPAARATAQVANCAPRDTVVTRLAEKYGETRRSMGLGHENAVVEVFASLQTGTWTITLTTPGGVTCLIASGQAFEDMADTLPPEGNDA